MNIPTELLLAGFGLLLGIIGWFVKRAFSRLDTLEAALEEHKLSCAGCKGQILNEIMDKMARLIDEKMELWLNKWEITLMNEGRIPPRRRPQGSKEEK